jgi:hypothetical protein
LLVSGSRRQKLKYADFWDIKATCSFVRTDVSQEHIASIFRVKDIFVRREDVFHDGRGRGPLATVFSLSCLPVTIEI